MLGDLKARTLYTGDRTRNPQGLQIVTSLTRHQWTNLNQMQACGMTTYPTKEDKNSMIDRALVASPQKQLWSSLEVANTHPTDKDTHRSVIAKSMVQIYYQPRTNTAQ